MTFREKWDSCCGYGLFEKKFGRKSNMADRIPYVNFFLRIVKKLWLQSALYIIFSGQEIIHFQVSLRNFMLRFWNTRSGSAPRT